ncbi:pyruvate dehydrogenase [Actinomycetospora sp. OC33-EN08]|uniref:Pyruvate dehydrogenase E1 component n=1 Tax=Actinomycetospora aurantiaca TaxID=3129233 RepID=A0ABU8MQ72_9PSEU
MTARVTEPTTGTPASTPTLDALVEVERRVLWLATAIVDHANRVRPNPGGLKVGGHQASSASIVSIMTALWFGALRAEDRVSVKPHASPVLHAINHLLGDLDARYLTTLRESGGLQSYPSRSKDPDPVDYSTGSVGIGATAPIWGAIARRYADGVGARAGTGRQFSLVGDAELDEGAVWEAVLDPMVREMGEVTWIVDFNRQSLDRVVPDISATRLQGLFEAAGWQVITVKYGRVLGELFAREGGDALRRRIDTMTNPEYQRLLRCTPEQLRDRLPQGLPDDGARVAELLASIDDDTVYAAIRNLGGHDLGALLDAYARIDDTRPTVVFAYTVKGYGLATQGHPQNHSSLLSEAQMRELAAWVGADLDEPWRPLPADSPAARLCADAAARLERPDVAAAAPVSVPTDLGRPPSGTGNTQQALGRALLDLTRSAPEAARRVVTCSPDVASSTNLGGWLNKVGSWAVSERRDWFDDDAETILHWRERPTGQHIELGIAETNLVGLLGELGATWSRWGEPLLPIGVLYDPFVARALEPWAFGMYAGGQSILVGTPSGVSLAPEGGAHQSITTPSIGLEQPGCVAFEPAFAIEVTWCLLDGLGRLGRPDGSSSYLRLSTAPVDQSLAAVPDDPAAREERRRQVVAGGYVLRRSSEAPRVTIAAMGATVPNALAAADRLGALGVPADVVVVTSADRLFRAVRARRSDTGDPSWILDACFPVDRAAPLVTVLDGHPHTLAFLAGVHGVRAEHLGVTDFGRSSDLASAHALHDIDADAIVRCAVRL